MTQWQEELVTNNLNLVYKIASGFKVPPADKQDLIQEGIMSLCLAAQRFDQTRGDKFVTYAYCYILGRCKYFVSRNALIKPVRSKESGYKKFVTSQTNSLENYIYVPDPNSSIKLDNTEELLKLLRDTEGDEVANILELFCDGYNIKEISKKLNLKITYIENLLKSLRDNDYIKEFFKE